MSALQEEAVKRRNNIGKGAEWVGAILSNTKISSLREQLQKMRKVKPWLTVVPVVIGALGAVTLKLGEWLQQIQERHLCREESRLRLSGLW